MNLHDLKYLVALAEHRHFSKAAEHCSVSQPTLSMQLKKMENELGVLLVERANRSVLLTNIGAVIAERAKQILYHVNELHDLSQLAQDPRSGTIKLGIFPTLGQYFLPHVIPVLSKVFPKIEFYLVEKKTASLIEALKEGAIDAAIVALPIFEENILEMPLFEEELVLAVPRSHFFAQQETVTDTDLAQQTVLLLEEGNCLRDQALSLCRQMNAIEDIGFKATSLEALRYMVMAGVGITVMPKLACYASEDLAYIPFEPAKYLRSLAMICRNSTVKAELLAEMAGYIKQIMAKQNIA